jgi:ATPase subunit of ABC transporter with duplicated ATPase domains
MGHVDLAGVGVTLDDGRQLLADVSFRVGDGDVVALIGANGSGKSTLMRLIAGDQQPTDGAIVSSGGLGVMPQFIGDRSDRTVRELLLAAAPARVREAGAALTRTEAAMAAAPEDESEQIAYANALTAWGDAGGYEAEVLWDGCCRAALGLGYDEAATRSVETLSGGEQKRLVLNALLRGPDEVLLLDEPDNYLDVPGKRWLEERILETAKTVLYITHDRELLARTAKRIITLEAGTAWTHGGPYATYEDARRERRERLEELHRRWREEHERLKELVRTLRQQATLSDAMASRYRAMQTRLAKFEEKGPPPDIPRSQRVRMRLHGGRTGERVVICEGLAIPGLVRPFDAEFFYRERIGVLGPNGTGKSHLVRLFATLNDPGGPAVEHTGSCRLGARVVPGHFAQTHAHPEWQGRRVVDLITDRSVELSRAMGLLDRYELRSAAEQRFETLSGGQQARLQVLMLEVSDATLLLLDEPTDNLDVASAEALEGALEEFDGTVLAVTHDRWFARTLDRFMIVADDGTVTLTPDPVWEPADAVSGAAAR